MRSQFLIWVAQHASIFYRIVCLWYNLRSVIIEKGWVQRHQIIRTHKCSIQLLLSTWKPRVCARISTLFYTHYIKLSFIATAGTPALLEECGWQNLSGSTHLSKRNHHVTIDVSFDMFTISRSILQWQIKTFVQWTLTLVWIQAFLALCSFSIIFLAWILNNNFKVSPEST